MNAMNRALLHDSSAFAAFSTNDIEASRRFYVETLGVEVTEESGMLILQLPGCRVLIYPKDDHQAATYTCLNFEVTDIDAVVDELARRGVTFEHYGDQFGQDERGIMRSEYGPPIAWFKDPGGNILSVIQQSDG